MAEQPEHPEPAEPDESCPTDEQVRAFPAIHVGNDGPSAMGHTLRELVAGSLAEVRAGFGLAVRITAYADGSLQISDDGRGLPAGPGTHTLESALTQSRTIKGSPAARDWSDYLLANLLSEWFRVESRHDGRVTRQDFRHGRPAGPPRVIGPAAGTGLTVTFRLNPESSGDTRLSADDLRDCLRQSAFLHSWVRLSFCDEAGGREEVFEYVDGILSFVTWLNAGRRPLHPDVVVARGEADGVRYEVGLQWCEEEEPLRRLFVNGTQSPTFVGTPVEGLRAAVTRSLNTFARDHLPGLPVLGGGQAWDGLTAIVSVRLAEPQFLGPLSSGLANPAARDAVDSGVSRALGEYLRANPDVAERVIRAAVIPRDGRSPMTEAEWLSSADAERMLRFVDPDSARRKAVLFCAACCRSLAGRGPDDRALIAAVEAHADGERAGTDFAKDFPEDQSEDSHVRLIASSATGGFGPGLVAETAALIVSADPAAAATAPALIRDVFGNPFRPVAFAPAWRSAAALDLARGMYDSRDFAAMPVLADALQDAGCEDPDVLAHCRGDGPHVRGCWVVDLILGKT